MLTNIDLSKNSFSDILEKLKTSTGEERISVLEIAITMVDTLQKSNELLLCCLKHEQHRVKLELNQVW